MMRMMRTHTYDETVMVIFQGNGDCGVVGGYEIEDSPMVILRKRFYLDNN